MLFAVPFATELVELPVRPAARIAALYRWLQLCCPYFVQLDKLSVFDISGTKGQNRAFSLVEGRQS
jgi:hypothetical protein